MYVYFNIKLDVDVERTSVYSAVRFDNRIEQSRFRVVAAILARRAVRLYFTYISKRCIRKYSREINRDEKRNELCFVPVCPLRTIMCYYVTICHDLEI